MSGEPLGLLCMSVSQSLPSDHPLVMSYSWRKNNFLLESGWRYVMGGPTLTVDKVTRLDHAATFSCQVEENGLNSNWSDGFVLDVLCKYEQQASSFTNIFI